MFPQPELSVIPLSSSFSEICPNLNLEGYVAGTAPFLNQITTYSLTWTITASRSAQPWYLMICVYDLDRRAARMPCPAKRRGFNLRMLKMLGETFEGVEVTILAILSHCNITRY